MVGMGWAISEWGLGEPLLHVSCQRTGLGEEMGRRVREQQPEPQQFSLGDIHELKARSQATVTLRDTCPPVPTLLRSPQERGTGEEAEKQGMVIPPPGARPTAAPTGGGDVADTLRIRADGPHGRRWAAHVSDKLALLWQ